MTLASQLTIAILIGVFSVACTKKEQPSPQTSVQNAQTPDAAPATASSRELKIEDIVEGKGAEAKAGKAVKVHYTGRLLDGTQFDSSIGREPLGFRLGSGQVIQGWEKGLEGMKVGGKRKLTIPPEMGYGEAGAGKVIPPDATLLFDVELVEVKD